MHRESGSFGLDHSTQVDTHPPLFDTDDQKNIETISTQNTKSRNKTEELLVDSGEHDKLEMMGLTKLSGDEFIDWQDGKCPLPAESVVTIIRFASENAPDKSELYYEYGDKPRYTVSHKDEKEKGKRRYLFVVKEFPAKNGEQPNKKMIKAQEVGERILPVFTKDRDKHHERTNTEWRKGDYQEMNSILQNPLRVDKRYVTILTNAKTDKPDDGEYYIMVSREKPGDEIISPDPKLDRDGFKVVMWEKRINVDTVPISAEFHVIKKEQPRRTQELLVESGEHDKLDMMGFSSLSGEELVDWQAGNCPLPPESVVTVIRFTDENAPDKSQLYYEYGDKPIYTVSDKNEIEKGKRRYLFVVKEFGGKNGEKPKKKMIKAQEVGERILPVFTNERNRNYERTKAEWKQSSYQEMNSIIGNPLQFEKKYVTLLTNAKSDNPSDGEYYIMTSHEKPGDEITSLNASLDRDGFRVLLWEKEVNNDTTPFVISFRVIKREQPLTSLSQTEVETHINNIFDSITSGEQQRFSSGELEQKAA